MAVVYLIRHAQASFGRSDYDKLSATGHRQAQLLGEVLARRIGAVDLVISGGMRRHEQTAEAVLAAMSLEPDRTPDVRWAEFDHQELIHRHRPAYRNRLVMTADLARTLKPGRAFQEMFDEALVRWAGAEYDAEYTESWPVFADRAASALDDLMGKLGKSQTALVFTSAGVISAICARLLGVSSTGWLMLNRVMVNGSVTKLVHGRRGTSLISFNDHAHFEGEHRDLLTYR